ncbi:MAG: SMC-Scp complex subunit ScpB [Acidiferrobacterales bacterium]
MSESNKELNNILEAALLVAGKPMSLKRMAALFPKDSVPGNDELKQAIAELEADYADRGIELKQVGKGYRFHSREKYSEWVSRLFEERPARYSRALLETLAIIAYRQPVTRGDIEEVRGVSVSTDTIRTLLEREWIREVGHRDVPGKPALFGTAPGFLEHFNLTNLSDLPTLSELRDLEEISSELNFSLDFGAEEEVSKQGHEPDALASSENIEDSAAETSVIKLSAGGTGGGHE